MPRNACSCGRPDHLIPMRMNMVSPLDLARHRGTRSIVPPSPGSERTRPWLAHCEWTRQIRPQSVALGRIVPNRSCPSVSSIDQSLRAWPRPSQWSAALRCIVRKTLGGQTIGAFVFGKHRDALWNSFHTSGSGWFSTREKYGAICVGPTNLRSPRQSRTAGEAAECRLRTRALRCERRRRSCACRP